MSTRRPSNHTRSPALFIVIGCLLLWAPLSAWSQGRLLVRLSSEPLIPHALESDFPILAGERIDLTSPEALAYLDGIDQEQNAFIEALRETVPEARIDHRYRVLYNGLVLANVPPAAIPALPGVVHVQPTDQGEFHLCIDQALALTGTDGLWHGVGGMALAGEGTRIALIDSGIDIHHPFFSPRNFTMPAGYPLGELPFTSAKVIAARAFFRPDDPVDPAWDSADPSDHLGHGSHLAGIAAGVAETTAELADGAVLALSGVAPRAQLLNYKVFYRAQSGTSGAREPEILAAMESAVVDGAGVIVCPFGQADLLGRQNETAAAFNAAIYAGVVMVAAAGNTGAGPGSVLYPGTLEQVLTVGASRSGRRETGWLRVESPGSVPEQLTRITAVKGRISPLFDTPVGPLPMMTADQASDGANPDGCAAFPYGALVGQLALIPRGECLFSIKAENAFLAGASAVAIYNHKPGEGPITMSGDPVALPTVMIGNVEGLAVEKWLTSHPGAMGSLHQEGHIYFVPESANGISEFSARGPTDADLSKPDLIAPGRSLISATAGPIGEPSALWEIRQGTSLAAGLVAGAAALLRQQHPDWSPRIVKAALIGSANKDIVQGVPWPLSTGGGRADLFAAAGTALIADPAVLSLGQGPPGHSFKTTLRIDTTTSTQTELELTWDHGQTGEGLSGHPDQGHRFTTGEPVQIAVTPSPAIFGGDYGGYLRVGRPGAEPELTIPYHLRVVPRRTHGLCLIDMTFDRADENPITQIYEQMVDRLAIEWHSIRLSQFSDSIELDELLQCRAIVVFTGNDQDKHLSPAGLRALDRLASYLRRGGRLLVAGQGPWRGTPHGRIGAVLGAATHPETPLLDPRTGLPIVLDEYTVEIVPDVFAGLPLDLDHRGAGLGDLALIGELTTVWGPGLPEQWVQPFLQMAGPPFEAGGFLGMLFDPYVAYGRLAVAEELTGRAAIIGFGFERINDGVPDRTDRQPFFELLLSWVTDRLTIDVDLQRNGKQVVLDIRVTQGEASQFEIDFGQSTPPVNTDYHLVSHEYAAYGTKKITIIARSPLGVVAIERLEFELEEVDPADDDLDASLPSDGAQQGPEAADCQCSTVGANGPPDKLASTIFEIWDKLASNW